MGNSNNDETCRDLETLLESARPFLRGELEKVDAELPQLMSVLAGAGAGECWHKHGSFLDHLLGVYRILKMWRAPDPVCLCGLFHSAYSNSYVNLAIFPPSPAGRDAVRSHVGPAAERLVHLFCVVPRQHLIHDLLLSRYPDDRQLAHHLRSSQLTLEKFRRRHQKQQLLLLAEEDDDDDDDDEWRAKIESVCPAEGITVEHIKSGEDILLSRNVVAVFLLLTMADFSDQLFSFQDSLFQNTDGRLDFSGNETLKSLWPGDGKPGLWINSVSRMAAIYTLIVREEEILCYDDKKNKKKKKKKKKSSSESESDMIPLVIPPVLEGCTRVVDARDQMIARDLYWEAVCGAAGDKAEEKLLESVERNPHVGEGHVVLAQIYLGKGDFAAAEKAAERGLRLLLEWGSPWDKRMTWQGWIAWARVLLIKARDDKSWPQTGFGILNLGLVT